MFSIFNGQVRGLGDTPAQDIYMKVSVKFRQYLHHFKGAKLAVFQSIALHADENGWSGPAISQLKAETGYESSTISSAITSLCNMQIDGKRVLLAVQEREQGKFFRNRYLIFPSPEEIERYKDEVRGSHRIQKIEYGFSSTVFPNTENQTLGINHIMEEPKEENTNTFAAEKPAAQNPKPAESLEPKIASSTEESGKATEKPEEKTIPPSTPIPPFPKHNPDAYFVACGDDVLGPAQSYAAAQRYTANNPGVIIQGQAVGARIIQPLPYVPLDKEDKPRAYADPRIFDAIGETNFNLKDLDEAERAESAPLIGKIRKRLISLILRKRKAKDLDEAAIVTLVLLIRAFGPWYDKQTKGGADRPRDADKYMARWIHFTKSAEARRIVNGEPIKPAAPKTDCKECQGTGWITIITEQGRSPRRWVQGEPLTHKQRKNQEPCACVKESNNAAA